MSKKRAAAALAALLLAAGFLLPGNWGRKSGGVVHQHQVRQPETEAAVGLDESGNLSTHLPLIILKTNGAEIPGAEERTDEVLYCDYAIIDNAGGVNRSDDQPTQTGRAAVSVRGNSSRDYRKKQYAFRIVDELGYPMKASVLGMPAESSWVLNGSVIDTAQIRNYMMLNISGEIMDYAPRCRLAELMLTDGEGNVLYQGLYTVIEKPKVSESRLNLAAYDPRYVETAFLLQMNNYNDGTVIPVLKPDDILSVCETGLEYPEPEKITEQSLHYIHQEMLGFEKALYDAYFTKDWRKLEKRLDLDSFVDYYILNEFFQNYDAGRRSTYLYKNLGGKLSIGPVWDWDSAFNNFGFEQMEISQLAMKQTYFYYYLSQYPEFCLKTAERYAYLRQNLLSDEYLTDYIDSCAEYLGSALRRDCGKWNPSRPELYLADLEAMKTFVLERGKWMDANFAEYITVIGEKLEK